jgi:hypothetical protein
MIKAPPQAKLLMKRNLDGQFFPALGQAALNDFAAVFGRHSGHEAVDFIASLFLRLIRSFWHSFIKFR